MIDIRSYSTEAGEKSFKNMEKPARKFPDSRVVKHQQELQESGQQLSRTPVPTRISIQFRGKGKAGMLVQRFSKMTETEGYTKARNRGEAFKFDSPAQVREIEKFKETFSGKLPHHEYGRTMPPKASHLSEVGPL